MHLALKQVYTLKWLMNSNLRQIVWSLNLG